MIRAEALAQRQLQGLEQRLERTQQALTKLAAKPASDCCALQNQVQAILTRHRTEAFFSTTITPQLITRQVKPGRPSRNNPPPQRTIEQFWFFLIIALRLFTLIDFVSSSNCNPINNPSPVSMRAIPNAPPPRPTTEQLLSAFDGITLYFLKDATLEITPLNS